MELSFPRKRIKMDILKSYLLGSPTHHPGHLRVMRAMRDRIQLFVSAQKTLCFVLSTLHTLLI